MMLKPPLGRQINWGHPLARGLVGAWLFNEGSGNVACDIVNGNDGTLTNMTPESDWVPGPNGVYLDFDGSDDNVILPAKEVIPAGGPISVAAGVIPAFTQDEASDREVFCSGTGVRLYFEESVDDWRWRLGSQNCDTNGLTWAAGDYMQIVGTQAGTVSDIYFNGEHQTTRSTLGAVAATAPSHIGCDSTLARDFPGGIDHILLWHRELTADEVRAVWLDPFAMFEPVPIWRFYTAPAAGSVWPLMKENTLGKSAMGRGLMVS